MILFGSFANLVNKQTNLKNNNNNLWCEKQVSFGKQVLGDCLFNRLYQQCSWPASAVCSVEAGRMPSAPLAVLSPGGQQVPDPGPAR